MRNIIKVLAVVLLLTSCSKSFDHDEFKAILVGEWKSSSFNAVPDSDYVVKTEGIQVFRDDGTVTGSGHVYVAYNESNDWLVKFHITFKGKWTVDKRFLKTKVIRADIDAFESKISEITRQDFDSLSEEMVAKPIVDEIVRFSEKEIVFKDIEDGTIEKFIR